MLVQLLSVALVSSTLLVEIGASTQTSIDPPEIDNVSTKIYKDTSTGVAFRYPLVWQVVSPNQQNGYLPAAILDAKRFQLQLNVVFSPAGNYYKRTNLQDLSFTYGVVQGADAEACHDLVAKNPERNSKAHTVINNNVAFTEASGSDGAMSHALNFTLDSTWLRGTCFVFERDEATIAPGVQAGKRTLRASEQAALQRHLDSVFQSVTFPSSGAK